MRSGDLPRCSCPIYEMGHLLFHKLKPLYGYEEDSSHFCQRCTKNLNYVGAKLTQYDPQHGPLPEDSHSSFVLHHGHDSWKQSPRTRPWHPSLQPLPRRCSEGLPLGRTGGLRTKGLVDKLVSTMAAVTLSMSSSSEDFLKHSEWEAGNTSANTCLFLVPFLFFF